MLPVPAVLEAGAIFIAAVLAMGCSAAEVVEPALTPTPPFVSGTRLRARIVDGGGGAVILEGWHDAKLDERCRFRPATDGRWRCLPDDEDSYVHSTENDIMYLDAACTQPVRVVAVDAPRLPRYVLGEPGAQESCELQDPPSTVHELGGELHPAELYWWLGDACELDGPVMNMRVFALGAELPPSELVGAEVVQEPRSDHLAATLLAAEDGAREAIGTFDRARAAPCGTLWLDSGPCIPMHVSWSVGEFSDASCTQAIAYTSDVVPGGTPSLSCPAPAIAIEHGSEGCDVEFRYFEVGERVMNTYRVEDGSCTPASSPGHASYVVGDSIPASAFPALGNIAVGSGRLRARHSAIAGTSVRATSSDFDDTETGVTCSALELCDGAIVCRPNYPGSALYFSDGTCDGEPLVLVGTSPDCPQPALPVHIEAGGTSDCIDAGETREVGEAVELPSVWQLDPTTGCVSGVVDQGPGYSYHRIGAEIPWSTFAKLERRTE